MISDPLDFAVALFAALIDGSWAAPLDPTVVATDDEHFDQRTSNLNLDVIVCDRAAPPHPKIPWVVVPGGDVAESVSGDLPARQSGPGGIILSSSGTTGRPKVIALTEQQLLHAANQIAAHNRLSSDDRGFNPLPLWHINAEVVGLLATLVAGASLVLDDRFHRTDFWSLVDRLEVTWINAVPAIISRIVEVNRDESVPSRLRFVRSASAPLSPALMTAFERNTGVAIVESYGMTEAASQICVNPLDGPRKLGSVGLPVGVELRVTAFEDPRASDGVDAVDTAIVGHVEIRGPSVITRYEVNGYEDRFDAQGWLKTGDLGFLDADGYLFLVGRSDDVINRGGEKIFPREIEEILLAQPGVRSAAVIGALDEVLGERPVAYVVPDAAAVADEVAALLRAVCAERLPRHKQPSEFWLVDEMPLGPTGKISRRLLKESVAAGS